jgi:flagellar hook-length control protein FliK
MDIMLPPSGTSPPEKIAVSPSRSSKSEKGSSLAFEKVLKARKAEVEDTQEDAASASAAVAAAAALQPVSPVLVQTTGGLSSEPTSPAQPVSSADTSAATAVTGNLTGAATNQPTEPIATAAIAGFEELLNTGQATTDPIGPEDQPVVTPALLPEDALATGVTFTQGTGTDGMKQGAVTVETSQAMPVLSQDTKAEPVVAALPDPVKTSTAALSSAAVAPAEQPAKTDRNTMENQPGSDNRSEESSKPRETISVKESAPKTETLASSVSVETTRQAPLVRETSQRPETQAATLAQQIHEGMEASIRQGKSTLRIQLSPQELGAIDIRLVSGPTGVSMTIIAEQASTGRLLEAQINQLRQNLADTGVQLSNLNINQHSQTNLANQGSNSQTNQQFSGNRFRRPFDTDASEDSGVALQVNRPQRGIDYRV